MPCFFPLQAIPTDMVYPSGKPVLHFSRSLRFDFMLGRPMPEGVLSVPCGRCVGCKLERSRQWAVRCVHESKCYDDNCFVTLTFADEHLPSDGSLSVKTVQLFMKRLRQHFFDRKIRVFYCGEYGDQLGRPHYHLCLFNLDFKDRIKWKRVNDFWYYVSDTLSRLWPFGFSTVSDFSFETAAYVARYCTKKISGSSADSHYEGRLPEFSRASNRPGIGKPWLDKFGFSDVYPHDCVLSRGAKCKPPRYYDVLRERVDPVGFAEAKEARRVRGVSKQDDNSFKRLAVKMKCLEARTRLLIRSMESM